MTTSLFERRVAAMAICLGALLAAREPETCLNRAAGYENPLCSEQLCVAESPALSLTNNFAPAATLTCYGCEQSAPTQIRLSAVAADPDTSVPFAQRRRWELTIELRTSWDRTFRPASLRAAFVSGTASIMNMERSTGGTELRTTSYPLKAEDIGAANLNNGRVQLTLNTHLNAGSTPLPGTDCYPYPGCACLWREDTAAGDSQPRTLAVNVPYAIYEPPPPPPPPLKVNIAQSASVICAGECVTLNASAINGHAPYTLRWDHGLPDGTGPHQVCPDATQTYVVTATDTPTPPTTTPAQTSAAATIAVRTDCAGPATPPSAASECTVDLPVTLNPGSNTLDVSGTAASDGRGFQYLAGSVTGTLDLQGATLAGIRSGGGFLAKYDGCRYVWSRRLDAANDEVIPTLSAANATSLTVAGRFVGETVPFTNLPYPTRTGGMFIARVGADGELLHARSFPAYWEPTALSLVVDAADSTLLTVYATNETDLGAGGLQFEGGSGIVFMRLDASGQTNLNMPLYGAGTTVVTTDAQRAIYLVGSATDAVRIGGGPSPAGEPTLTQAGFFRFAAKLDAAGSVQYLVTLPPISETSDQGVRALAAASGDSQLTVHQCAYSELYFEDQCVLRRLDATGALVWEQPLARSDNARRQSIISLTQLASGEPLLLSSRYDYDLAVPGAGTFSTALERHAASGPRLFERTFWASSDHNVEPSALSLAAPGYAAFTGVDRYAGVDTISLRLTVAPLQ